MTQREPKSLVAQLGDANREIERLRAALQMCHEQLLIYGDNERGGWLPNVAPALKAATEALNEQQTRSEEPPPNFREMRGIFKDR